MTFHDGELYLQLKIQFSPAPYFGSLGADHFIGSHFRLSVTNCPDS
jgi:hypothetical protein